jgi:hypothetical protein
MSTHDAAHSDARLLVQRLLHGDIPHGDDFNECRQILRNPKDSEAALNAMFTLLQGVVSDPLYPVEDSVRAVAVLKALARGELHLEALL